MESTSDFYDVLDYNRRATRFAQSRGDDDQVQELRARREEIEAAAACKQSPVAQSDMSPAGTSAPTLRTSPSQLAPYSSSRTVVGERRHCVHRFLQTCDALEAAVIEYRLSPRRRP